MNITTTGKGKSRGGLEIGVIHVNSSGDKSVFAYWRSFGDEVWWDTGKYQSNGYFFSQEEDGTQDESFLDIVEFTPDVGPSTAVPQDPTPEQHNCLQVLNKTKRLIEDVENHEKRIVRLEQMLDEARKTIQIIV